MTKRVMKKFSMIFFPIILVWFLLLLYLLLKNREVRVDRLIYQNRMNNENIAALIKNRMDSINENMTVLTDMSSVNDYLEMPSEENRQKLEEILAKIVTDKKYYLGIQFINRQGLETISVSRIMESAEPESMVSRHEDAYYQAAVNMSKGDMYVSELEIDWEKELNNYIVKIAIPVFDNQGKRSGVLALDYQADFFMNLIYENILRNSQDTGEYYLLNNAGTEIFSYLAQEKKWKTGPGSNWISNPVFDLIQKKSSHYGYWKTRTSLYTYSDLLSTSKNDSTSVNDQWILLHKTNLKVLLLSDELMKTGMIIRNILQAVCLAILVFAISFYLEIIKRKDDHLDITMLIAQSSNDAIIIADHNMKITFANSSYKMLTGYTEYQLVGHSLEEFKSGRYEKEFYEKIWKSVHKEGVWEGNIWSKKRDGLLYTKKLQVRSVIRKGEKDPHHFIGILSDINAGKRTADGFNFLQYQEGEITFNNQEMMIRLLEENMCRSYAEYLVLNIVIENYNQLLSYFDGWKFHADESFNAMISEFIGEKDFIAQTERNRYVAVISLTDHKIDAESHVRTIYKALSKVMSFEGRDFFFKIRIGISNWPNDTKDLNKLLLNSVVALEWSEKDEGNEIVFFHEKMIDELNMENKIESNLKKAIENKELYLVYQPQVNSDSGKVIGIEALIRWNNEELGFVSPSTFIPIAERSNLIIDIGKWVIEQVCMDLHELEAFFGHEETDFRCAINVSSIQIEDDSFMEILLSQAEKYQVAYSRIEIEITESILMKDHKKRKILLDEFQKLGIRIALDDFGTGYSSFAYLHTLPIEKIKIDRSFIKDYPDYDDGQLIRVLVDMSQKLQKIVITEGVETEEQADFLRHIGCNYIQGFLYSKPVELKEFVKYYMNKTGGGV